jgi:hypothetical protein
MKGALPEARSARWGSAVTPAIVESKIGARNFIARDERNFESQIQKLNR